MLNGIYHMVVSSAGRHTEGWVVVDGDRLNGAGNAYLFQGVVREEQNVLSGTVTVSYWNRQEAPVLGPFKEVMMPVSGAYNPQEASFGFEGQAGGHHVIRLRASGRYIAPLA